MTLAEFWHYARWPLALCTNVFAFGVVIYLVWLGIKSKGGKK